MKVYTTYTKEEMVEAANKKLQIVSDYDTNLVSHLNNIKQKILIDDNSLISIIAAINAGFNVILYGPPGTAKSTISEFLPVELYGAKCNVHTADSEWNVRKVIGGVTVTYDSSTTPAAEKIGPKDGYIVEDILECYATRFETREYDTTFTVIDEFNRTNMDECLGPMFTAMGSNNRTLKLDYNKGFNDSFLEIIVPNGYRMLCNMNKYDRTFTNELSDALSRRFKWIYIGTPSVADYESEEDIVRGNVFGDTASIAPVLPVNLKDIPDCVTNPFFESTIQKAIFDIINDLRHNLEIGTSYKIDAVKLAWHFFELKIKTIDLSRFSGVTEDSIKASSNTDEAIASIVEEDAKNTLKDLLNELINETVDAALVMTVIPACEAIEDIEAIEKNKNRFNEFKRCKAELNRMKQIL